MTEKPCACNKQIVWWWGERGTIYACKNCEITFHYTQERCPHCGEQVTEFLEQGDYND